MTNVEKEHGFIASSLSSLLRWAESNSLSYVSTGSACCADELMTCRSARYDLERFGALPQIDPVRADLLIITGSVNYRAAAELRRVYDQMLFPKYVMAIGSCACSGGPFSPEFSYAVVPGADRIVPVDVYVPGCPPRPEAILHGLLELQNKIIKKAEL